LGKLPVMVEEHPACQVADRQMRNTPRHPGRWSKLASNRRIGHGQFSPAETGIRL